MSHRAVSRSTVAVSRRGPSRHGGDRPLTSNGRAPSIRIRCNRCSKPLVASLFLCACNCVFCEECSFEHFNKSSSCPSCHRDLKQDDFTDLAIANPSSAVHESTKRTFQTLFTKTSPNSSGLTQAELCSRTMKIVEDGTRVVKFVLRQLVVEANKQARQFSGCLRTLESLKKEYHRLKEVSTSERLQNEQTISDLEQRLQVMSNELEEKDTQIRQFRQSFSQAGRPQVPLSRSNSYSSAGKPGSSHCSQQRPPMAGFVEQKRQQQREKLRARQEMVRERTPVAMRKPRRTSRQHGLNVGAEAVATPGQFVTHRPYSDDNTVASSLGSGGIRDLSNSTGYVFNSRPSKCRRVSNSNERNSPISPAMAFAYNNREPSYSHRGFGRR